MKRVMEIISEVGGMSPIAADTSIYEVGFSSQRVLDLLLTLEDEFRVTIPDKDFIAARTPRAIAGLLERLQEKEAA